MYLQTFKGFAIHFQTFKEFAMYLPTFEGFAMCYQTFKGFALYLKTFKGFAMYFQNFKCFIFSRYILEIISQRPPSYASLMQAFNFWQFLLRDKKLSTTIISL